MLASLLSAHNIVNGCNVFKGIADLDSFAIRRVRCFDNHLARGFSALCQKATNRKVKMIKVGIVWVQGASPHLDIASTIFGVSCPSTVRGRRSVGIT